MEPDYRLRWTRIFALMFAIAAFVILRANWPSVVAFLDSMGQLGSPRGEDRMMGLAAFCVVGILIAGLVKILTHGPR